jgi:hypothetical protein
MSFCFDGKTLTLYDDFAKDFDKIKEIINTHQIEKISNASIDDIGLLNYSNNQIKEIVYLQIIISENLPKQNLNNLPSSLEILNLDMTYFEFEKLDNLPLGLKKLSLPNIYSYELDNLPFGLESLSLSTNNDFQPNLSYLPESLIDLTIYVKHHMINLDNLPNNLVKLAIIGNYPGTFDNLPRGLKILHLPQYFQMYPYNFLIRNVPNGLEELKIPIEYIYLKNIYTNDTKNQIKLKKLIIGDTETIIANKSNSSFDLSSIQNTIEELEFGNEFNQILTYLPSNLKKLKLGFNFNRKIFHSSLPDSLEELEFGYNYNQSIQKYPPNLKILKFNRNFSSNLTNLPENLIRLEINERFMGKLTNLPQTLQILRFNEYCEFNENLVLPDSLEILELGRKFHSKLSSIPKSLKYIKYPMTNEKITKLLVESNYSETVVYYS